ncbi:MAG: hypothetical protein UU08_C0022G0015 [Candidatus Uhrbacteria bacterium GW2011_GWE2_40_58]|nr:MAG: hypothetical protein UT94_C0054G0006 [Candidatus Uhrbacteria bacterium GW2011_GWF2_40_263]KKR67264.1 MAG: hypothetical protein UU08_C0022G0015 [Candidatus Uhrbacteria bacterium GW2011_GWE2_40_58]OGL93035.1 MAG: hypothetical protein A2239_00990 [Candidatus Uhrbacteria bacterium RIFOXYA2_FULL_40_9]OGL97762.1 MAG: hypothetical protein A2332_02310 [Candidatus Uhrbacteria bacterium RIFOXYB2_FULL_41_18]HBK35139.1 hypothetical protein [Candidatus Uhrbacteria bacterium]
MGGDGDFFARDTTSFRDTQTRTGASQQAEAALSNTNVNPAMLPMERILRPTFLSPVAFPFDVTGSNIQLARIIWDKAPVVAGELAKKQYLVDPAISVAAVGDAGCGDRGPIQIGDFVAVRHLDNWLQRMWLESCGGGNQVESYELTAYFYAYCCELPEGCTPFCVFTGDEGFYEKLYANELRAHFGGTHSDTTADQVFADLRKKFKGNVFLIHRFYNHESADATIVRQWERVLGKGYVLRLKTDKAIADVTLGLFALMGGSRTLDEYCEDIRGREQTDERIREVCETLKPLTVLPAYTAARERWLAEQKRGKRKPAATKVPKAPKATTPPDPAATEDPNPKKKKRRF